MQKWAGDTWDVIKSVIGGIIILLGIPAMTGLLAWASNLPPYEILLIISASVALCLFSINQYQLLGSRGWRRIKKLSEKKLESRIKKWIDKPAHSIRRNQPDSTFKFNYIIEDQFHRIVSVYRDHKDSGLVKIGGLINVPPDNREMSEAKIRELSAKIKIEMARLGVGYLFVGVPNIYNKVSLLIPVNIDDNLTELYLLNNIDLMIRSIILIFVLSEQVIDGVS